MPCPKVFIIFDQLNTDAFAAFSAAVGGKKVEVNDGCGIFCSDMIY
jgi:hypothetical protein